MKRKCLAVGIILLFIGTAILPTSGQTIDKLSLPMSRGNWLYVGGSGPGNYSTIQSAINNVTSGDTIFVFNGIYYENVFLGYYKENITLIGEDKENTIIDGMNTPDIDTFIGYCNYLTISGFTFRNASRYGLYAFGWSSGHDVIRNNIFIGNNQGGLVVYQSDSSIISGNSFSNSQYGLYLASSKYCSITNNNFSFNNESLFLGGEYYTKIYNNVFTNNYLGIDIQASTCNIIYHNNFISNQINAHDDSHNFWDNNSQGNYWSDYTGNDSNGDGIGDTPYNIPGGNNQDFYPLMHTFEMYLILNVSLDNHEVNEGTPFNVTVKTLGGTVVPEAQVSFDNESKLTDSSGIVQFTAPMVNEDVFFQIVASKTGYTSANDTILVKNVIQKSVRAFIFGKITNLSTQGDYITFEAVKTRVITFSPFCFNTYVSGEKFTISKDYKGLVGKRHIFARCKILI